MWYISVKDSLPGTILDGRYQVEDVLGKGGMGTVYKAREIGLERTVALKVIHKNRLEDEENLIRFEREGRILSSFSHEHIIQFYRFGISQDGTYYIAMEYLSGETLRKLLSAENKLGWKRAVRITMQICKAVEYAHKQGIFHRDLKPENIMLISQPEPDFVKVFDFGLARQDPLVGGESASEYQKLTSTGQLIGSVNYLSPEQCTGHNPDQRSDIYSLACILYEMLAGTPPFVADNAIGVIYKHANETAMALSEVCGEDSIPEQLELAVSRGLMKDACLRFQSMNEFYQELEKICCLDPEDLKIAGRHVSIWSKKNGYVACVILVLLIFASSGVVLSLRKSQFKSASQKSLTPEQTKQRYLLEDKMKSLAILDKQIARVEGSLQRAESKAEKEKLAVVLVKDQIQRCILLARIGDFEAAEKMFNEMEKNEFENVYPDLSDICSFGDIEFGNGKTALALAKFEKGYIQSRKLGAPHAEAKALCHIAMVQVATHKFKDANDTFDKIRAIWSSSEELDAGLVTSIHNRFMSNITESKSVRNENISSGRKQIIGAVSGILEQIVVLNLGALSVEERHLLLILSNKLAEFLRNNDASAKLTILLSKCRKLALSMPVGRETEKDARQAFILSALLAESSGKKLEADEYRKMADKFH